MISNIKYFFLEIEEQNQKIWEEMLYSKKSS